ncbi:hypothetical protein PIIN_02886 [Serendipita indica DSM 11827]|uniref:C2H2-type domain-containing protein n=1 Tax=Serendipita indica (strain DSM 11827) TaxID=1109443 RepID=G4TCH6_SERID|nr:hypothetical protein PIIN_02886 [Serendipita indica DSM 11827]
METLDSDYLADYLTAEALQSLAPVNDASLGTQVAQNIEKQANSLDQMDGEAEHDTMQPSGSGPAHPGPLELEGYPAIMPISPPVLNRPISLRSTWDDLVDGQFCTYLFDRPNYPLDVVEIFPDDGRREAMGAYVSHMQNGILPPPRDLMALVVTQGDTSYCPFPNCNFQKSRYDHVTGHIVMEHLEVRIECVHCGGETRRKADHKVHLLRHAGLRERPKCPECEQDFDSAFNLRRHAERTHPGGHLRRSATPPRVQDSP